MILRWNCSTVGKEEATQPPHSIVDDSVLVNFPHNQENRLLKANEIHRVSYSDKEQLIDELPQL